ncbi:52 kDa repressor of the inhibitor of the protein kinase [Biomphalaria glabrata]|nr:52 kDa repressor of the inhibitor of the protein kinase [Biomphalaria glabrata]
MKLEVEFKIPRQASREINRVNIDTLSVEEYYRIAIYIPMIESMISDLLSRFVSRKFQPMCLSRLIPKVLIKTDVSETSFSFINDSVNLLIPELIPMILKRQQILVTQKYNYGNSIGGDGGKIIFNFKTFQNMDAWGQANRSDTNAYSS